MMRFLERKEGITLIALIISIIVMLVLAGVSINAIVGNNGIITNAIEAAKLADITDVKEQIELALIGYYDDSGEYTVDLTDILDRAKAIWWCTTNDKGENVITNGFTVVTEGDSIEYNAVKNASMKSYTSESSASGYTENQIICIRR